MSRFCLLLFALLAASSVQAQPFERGYVVAGGDTLRGEVALGTESENASGVLFRASPGAEPVRFEVDAASAFGAAEGRRYRRGQYQIRFARDPDSFAENDRIAFARVVREGAADLLALEVSAGEAVYYLQRRGETVGLYLARDEIETGERRDRRTRARGRRVRERPLYRQALSVLLTDGCDRPPKTDGLPYTERALAETVDAYNRCVDADYVGTVAPGPTRSGWEVRGEVGIGFATGTFDGAGGSGFGSPDLMWPRLGVGIAVRLPFTPAATRVVARLEYERDVFRFPFATNNVLTGPIVVNRSIVAVDVLHMNVGVRLSAALGPVNGRLGVGLLAGPAFQYTARENVAFDDRGDTAGDVVPRWAKASTGQYAELGLGTGAVPVDLVVRVQRTEVSGGVGFPFIPFASGPRYDIMAWSAGLAYTF